MQVLIAIGVVLLIVGSSFVFASDY